MQDFYLHTCILSTEGRSWQGGTQSACSYYLIALCLALQATEAEALALRSTAEEAAAAIAAADNEDGLGPQRHAAVLAEHAAAASGELFHGRKYIPSDDATYHGAKVGFLCMQQPTTSPIQWMGKSPLTLLFQKPCEMQVCRRVCELAVEPGEECAHCRPAGH